MFIIFIQTHTHTTTINPFVTYTTSIDKNYVISYKYYVQFHHQPCVTLNPNTALQNYRTRTIHNVCVSSSRTINCFPSSKRIAL